jgi:hypothetical protein
VVLVTARQALNAIADREPHWATCPLAVELARLNVTYGTARVDPQSEPTPIYWQVARTLDLARGTAA